MGKPIVPFEIDTASLDKTLAELRDSMIAAHQDEHSRRVRLDLAAWLTERIPDPLQRAATCTRLFGKRWAWLMNGDDE